MYLCRTTLRFHLFNTHNERALVYLFWHIQPVYNYAALRLFPDPGFSVCAYFGAGKEARTPDLLLGKQMYYQLYYTRIILFTILVWST